ARPPRHVQPALVQRRRECLDLEPDDQPGLRQRDRAAIGRPWLRPGSRPGAGHGHRRRRRARTRSVVGTDTGSATDTRTDTRSRSDTDTVNTEVTMATGQQILELARKHVGETYHLGAR